MELCGSRLSIEFRVRGSLLVEESRKSAAFEIVLPLDLSCFDHIRPLRVVKVALRSRLHRREGAIVECGSRSIHRDLIFGVTFPQPVVVFDGVAALSMPLPTL